MKKIIGQGAFIGMVLLLGILSSCQKDYYTPETVDIPDDVSYKTDIQPIWDGNCTNCHAAGKTKPNLEASASYNELQNGYISDPPETSKIYTKIAPGGSMAKYMPPGKEALVLKWIADGAQNN